MICAVDRESPGRFRKSAAKKEADILCKKGNPLSFLIGRESGDEKRLLFCIVTFDNISVTFRIDGSGKPLYNRGMIEIAKNEKILFEGDSVTDALRDRSDKYSLAGYSSAVAGRLSSLYPSLQAECYNRGVGGDTSSDLLRRLPADLEEVKPTVFSLLIGINDTWRRFDSGNRTSAEKYGENVEKILNAAEEYTRKIIILEPFLLDVDPKKKVFREDLCEKIFVLREIAARHRTEFVPLNGIFAEACCRECPQVYSYDGVHPAAAGHALIAEAWLQRVYAGKSYQGVKI